MSHRNRIAKLERATPPADRVTRIERHIFVRGPDGKPVPTGVVMVRDLAMGSATMEIRQEA